MKDKKAVGMVLKMIHRLCPEYLPMLVVQKLILTSVPYVNIIFSSVIINAMLEGKVFDDVFQYVLWMISLNCILNMVGWGLDKLINIRKYVLADQVQKMISEKALTLDYELLENKETLEYINKAKLGMQSDGDIGSFCYQIANMIGVVSDLIYTVILFIPVFFPVDTAGQSGMLYHILNSPWSSILPGSVLLAQTSIWAWSSKNRARLRKESFELNVEGNRRFGYYLSFMHEYAKGKDIRMYEIGKTIMDGYQEGICGLVEIFGKCALRLRKYSLIMKSSGSVFGVVSYVYVGAKAVMGMVKVGDVIRYVSAFTKFSSALGQIADTYTGISLCAAYLSYFAEFMEIKNEKYDGTLPVEKRDDNEYEFEFRNVSFSYPNSEESVLEHVSMKLKIGGKMAIVGPNGAGKTTFIKLLCRLYDPTEGEILLNGIDIRYYDYNEYISLFSVVFQDFKLFPFSIAENVAVSKEFDEARVKDCLEKAGFSERLGTLDKDIHTNLYKLEEDGLEVSGGEAQKIAIARALYKDSPLVILDEPTSALDPVSEYEIYQSFDELVEEKTALYISHRMSSCRFCDQIIVFAQGNIIQQGSHEKLLAEEEGLYYEMWNAQAQYYQ